MIELTPQQREVLVCCYRSVRDRGFPPSLSEIQAEIGCRHLTQVRHLLDALARKGYLAVEPSTPRGIRLLGLEVRFVGFAGVRLQQAIEE